MSDIDDRLPLKSTPPHLKEFEAFLKELNKESDRGVVLISCVMIDDLLGRTIQAYLLEHKDVGNLLEGFSAPLGTFSARILAAFSLGLITEAEYGECEILRKIRNAFAHDVHVSFKDQRIVDLCRHLSMCARDYGEVHVGEHGRFITSATSLILNLTNRPHYAAQIRLKTLSWPH